MTVRTVVKVLFLSISRNPRVYLLVPVVVTVYAWLEVLNTRAMELEYELWVSSFSQSDTAQHVPANWLELLHLILRSIGLIALLAIKH